MALSAKNWLSQPKRFPTPALVTKFRKYSHGLNTNKETI